MRSTFQYAWACAVGEKQEILSGRDVPFRISNGICHTTLSHSITTRIKTEPAGRVRQSKIVPS
jgi:hypothetical protein